MCGIVGYIGSKEAASVLLDGLARLSYRGYDSAGAAVIDAKGQIHVRKTKGRLENLRNLLKEKPLFGNVGIGHTRWATHGEPSEINAHPHTDVCGEIAVVHNGIIENHAALKAYLKGKGVQFVSQTDTEVVAHLLHSFYQGDMRKAIMSAMGMMEGSYALGIVCSREPDKLYCARNDSPLVIGFCDGESFLASDIPAILSHTRDVVFLQNKEIAVLERKGFCIFDAYGNKHDGSFFHIDWDITSAEKGGYPHYMLKEIHEQPEAMRRTMTGRNLYGDYTWLPFLPEEAKRVKKISIVACGTSYHAGMIGRYAIEKLARIPVEVSIASEYRYWNSIIGNDEWMIAVSQSGETADTLAAIREGKASCAKMIAICNAVGSSISREIGEENTLYTYAGPEIAVASTKAYVTQAELLILMALALADMRGMLPVQRIEEVLNELAILPLKAEEALKAKSNIQRIANGLSQKKHVFFVGRGADYMVSMEAALKLKEVSYVFSEAYAAGELKHGPIALLEEGSVIVATITQPHLLEKVLSNLQEITARGARVIAICTERMKERVRSHAQTVITVPDADPVLAPLLTVIPLQMFAYCMAVERGCDVDQPRNLAKSVTVE